jgi:hypothetical protein
MLQALRFDQGAPWKQRFRAAAILWTQLAGANKTRGIDASTHSGVAQIYAWDIPTGSLRQVTQHEGGLYYAYLSADGRYIYYHDDTQGNEMLSPRHILKAEEEGPSTGFTMEEQPVPQATGAGRARHI